MAPLDWMSDRSTAAVAANSTDLGLSASAGGQAAQARALRMAMSSTVSAMTITPISAV